MRRALLTLPAVAALLATAGPATAAPLPGAPRCPLFPPDAAWNRRVDALPVHPRSDRIVAAIGAEKALHADFGAGRWEGGPIGIPFNVVGRGARRVPVGFEYAGESDRGRYPIPRRPRIEHGSDRHLLVVDRDACRLHELFAARRGRDGRWQAGSGARWNLRSSRLRPRGWTSADAAGLPILPLLARADEVRRGVVDHALRMTVSRSRRAFVWPARHFASALTDPDLPAMGQRLRLRASFDVSGFPPQARALLRAMQRHGLLVADNGSDWFVSGAPSPAWDDEQLRTLRRVRGADLEVVAERRP